MCTVSWITEGDGYRLWFNRDEQFSRARAEAPFVWNGTSEGGSFLAPRDPEGGGTWIAVNREGVLVALLNYYERAGALPMGVKSRGGLVIQLVQKDRFEAVAQALKNMDLEAYAAFHLLIIGGGKESLSTWNGKTLSDESLVRRFWTTSSMETARVKAARLKCYFEMIKEADVTESHRALHRVYQPDDGAGSVCMRREDAQSVSHVEVVVDSNKVEMHYGERLGGHGFESLVKAHLDRR